MLSTKTLAGLGQPAFGLWFEQHKINCVSGLFCFAVIFCVTVIPFGGHMKETRKIAAGAMMAALCLVIMLLGAVIDLGTYAAALLAGVAMIPYGQKYGRKYQMMVFASSAALSFMLVPNIEQNLMYLGFYGWYPVLRPGLEKLHKLSRYTAKFIIFNVCFISIEALVMLVLVPEDMGGVLFIIFIIAANVTFFAYDYMIPLLDVPFNRIKSII